MFPANMLGDAAAAETMVTQATKSERNDQRKQEEIFDRYLYRSQEVSRLTVQPISVLSSSQSVHNRYENPTFSQNQRRKDNQKKEQKSDEQLMLFSIEPDRTVTEYGKPVSASVIGEHVDIKA